MWAIHYIAAPSLHKAATPHGQAMASPKCEVTSHHAADVAGAQSIQVPDCTLRGVGNKEGSHG